MRIAYVVPYVPNLIRTRPYNLIVHLAALGHDVEVFTLGAGIQDRIDAQALGLKCKAVHYYSQPVVRSLWNSVMALPSHQPLQSVYSWQMSLARDLAGRVRGGDFDIIHVEHLRGSRFGLFLKSKFPSVPVIWDSVDCISYLFEQAAGQSTSLFGKFATRFDLPRTRRAEGTLVGRFDHVLVTSVTDRHALLSLVPAGVQAAPVSVLPNGVDLEYFCPRPDELREPATVVLSGKMSYHANIAMVNFLVEEIMPRVWAEHPRARICIVGKDPPAAIKLLEKNPLITVTGTVEDIRSFLWHATVAVVPLLYGAGIQNKILEAMATATPVVTAARTLSALQGHPGRDLLVAGNAGDFAREISRLISDPALRHKIGACGLEYVRKNHDWNVMATRLAEIYHITLHGTKDVLHRHPAVAVS